MLSGPIILNEIDIHVSHGMDKIKEQIMGRRLQNFQCGKFYKCPNVNGSVPTTEFNLLIDYSKEATKRHKKTLLFIDLQPQKVSYFPSTHKSIYLPLYVLFDT